MNFFIKKLLNHRKTIKKVLGIILVVLGVLAHLIPFVPASGVIFIGLGFLGIPLLLPNKIKNWFLK